MYRNVVVAYDGSEVARIALARAAGIARGDGASLTLVEAVAGKVPSPAPGGPPLAKPEKRAMAREDLNKAIEQLDPKLEAGGWVIGGSPAKGILTVADDIGADLIVTGSRARGAVTRTVLGSVSCHASTRALPGGREHPCRSTRRCARPCHPASSARGPAPSPPGPRFPLRGR